MLLQKSKHDFAMSLLDEPNKIKQMSDDELLSTYKKVKEGKEFFRMMEQVVKILCNSVYGGFGTNSLRYFNQAVAEDITGEGRYYCKLTDKSADKYFREEWANDMEWFNKLKAEFPDLIKVDKPKPITKPLTVYADTDSNYVTFDYIFESLDIAYKKLHPKKAVDFIEFFSKNKLDPFYDKILKDAIAKRNGKSTMIFELEVIGGYGIFVAKKKYIFSKLWIDGNYVAAKGGLKSTGIEIVQSSTSEFVRDSIKTFVNIIFSKRGNINSTLFFNMCKALSTKLEDIHIDDISKIQKIKTYDNYVIDYKEKVVLKPKCPAAVRGAARYNHLVYKNKLQGKYAYLKPGMRVKMYYDEQGQPFAYHDEKFPEEIAPPISRKIQLEKLIFRPVKRLVSGGMISGDLDKMGSDRISPGFSTMFKKS